MCLFMCIHVCEHAHRGQREVSCPGAVLVDSHEPPDVGAVNHLQYSIRTASVLNH